MRVKYLKALVLLVYAGVSPALPLNDTGIIRCGSADGSSNDLNCPQAGAPGQDAEFGRDVTHNDDSDGKAGFSFSKLDASGNELSVSASAWSCVKDNVTGLIWEVKTDDGGLQDKDHSYTWYSTDNAINGGIPGTRNGGQCGGSDCDTQSYVQAINAMNLCGANDWRLPTREELRSIVDYGTVSPAIDTAYFPNTRESSFWSASVFAKNSGFAWVVSFNDGKDFIGLKYTDYAVRLVRGGQ